MCNTLNYAFSVKYTTKSCAKQRRKHEFYYHNSERKSVLTYCPRMVPGFAD